jgi:serine protease DegS
MIIGAAPPGNQQVITLMAIRKSLSFLLRAVTTGLALAFLYILVMQPRLLHGVGNVVEVRETPAPAAAAENGGMSGPVSYADAVGRAMPAVVNIQTAKVITRRVHPLLDDPIFQHFFGNRLSGTKKEIQTSLGSGVIISSQGYILTNNHVISGADEIQVLLGDGRSVRATVVGEDAETDLAILRIVLDKLPTIVIGDSKSLRVGDIAMAIGNPYGVGQTVTLGIISATGRDHLGINTYEDFIQTDAAINPGNSGGALINARGELIGINSAIYSRSGGSQGIGFAIPVNMAKGVMKQIIEHGHVVRGWLGIEAQDLTTELAQALNLDSTSGVLISGVLRGGPADTAGIQPGDVVLTINAQPVKEAQQAMRLISELPPDAMVRLEGSRQGKPFSVQAKVSQRPAAAATD